MSNDNTDEKGNRLRPEDRRKILTPLIVSGLPDIETLSKFAEQTGYKISLATLSRDKIIIKEESAKRLEKLIKSFNIEGYWAQILGELSHRRETMVNIMNSADKDAARVAAAKQLEAIDLETEQIYNKLGIITSRVNPEDVAGQAIIIRDVPPPMTKPKPNKSK